MKKLILTLAVFATTSAQAAQKMTFCIEDTNNPPWQNAAGTEGLDVFLVKKVTAENGIDATISILPWKRCLADLGENKFDGAFAASFKEERKELGHYPEKDGKYDESLRIHTDSYSVFTTPNSKVKVLNGKIEGTSKVGSILGYAIVGDLKKAGLNVDESPNSEQNFKKLVAGRIDAVVTTSDLGKALMETPEFKGKVTQIKPELVVKPYFLMLSKKFVKENDKLAAKIWQDVKRVRESAEYKAKAK